MRCEQCRERDAVVNLTTIKDGVVTQTHLCERCAQAQGVEMRASVPPIGEFVAHLESRGDAAEIARYVRRLEQHVREHPDVPLPPELAAFVARHTPPPTT